MALKTEVLIIGSGIAGLFSALKISEYADVIIVTKKESFESNTNYAQGGIASVIDAHDSFEKHIEDTLIAGAGLCDYKAVELMIKEGPERIQDLIEIGTRFTRRDGKLDLAKEGGHSAHRIVHAQDLTGKEVERALIDSVNEKSNIRIMENCIAIDLLTEHNVMQLKDKPLDNRNCWGAYILDTNTSEVIKICSKATVIATGGLGQVYLHTTNPTIATGDGFAMAYRAGAKLANMEFVQFHPTALFQNTTDLRTPSFLISEAVRGFGGILRTGDYKEFMGEYDTRKELAPRDIVARAIDNELKKRGDEYVYLDITHLNANDIIEHFPNIYHTCKKYGIDITAEPIPVVPAAHYACGGVIVDQQARTSLNGLFACGEVTMTGVHGGNRLASNSLLEALVYAFRAAQELKGFVGSYTSIIPDVPDWDESGTLSTDEKVLISHSLREVKQVMWDYVGIVRSNLRLERASKRIHNLYIETENLYKKTKVFEDIISLRNITTCSHMIIKSSTLRKESRGLHYTLDYPFLQETEPRNTILQNNNY